MDTKKKEGRYQRIFKQLEDLCSKEGTPLSRMASIAAVLHHKMEYFFWTGFYIYENNRLSAGPYQGPVACQELKKGEGVCWASILRDAAIIVPDVDQFPGHIACDSRSKSEIAIPVKDKNGICRAVMDVDSSLLNQFDHIDETNLKNIVNLIY